MGCPANPSSDARLHIFSSHKVPKLWGEFQFLGAGFGPVSQRHTVNVQNGNILWKTHLGSPIFSTPAISNKFIIVATVTGCVYKIDLKND